MAKKKRKQRLPLPTKFTADGEPWTIKRVMDLVGKRDVFDLGGDTSPKLKRVQIDGHSALRWTIGYLFHELGHVAWFKAGMQDRYSDKIEEEAVDAISSWLILILRENPELARYLLQEIEGDW